MRLEYEHPKVAFRDCQHCRKYVYDEKTGKPRESRGRLLERSRAKKGPPCEDEDEGCPKGHWRDPIVVPAKHLTLLAAYEACRATGGASMTEAERSDSMHLLALSRIDEVVRSGEASLEAARLAANLSGILISSSGGTRSVKPGSKRKR